MKIRAYFQIIDNNDGEVSSNQFGEVFISDELESIIRLCKDKLKGYYDGFCWIDFNETGILIGEATDQEVDQLISKFSEN